MCRSMEAMRDKAWCEGKAEGKAEALYSLVLEGILTLSQAADRMGLSESEFTEKIRKAGISAS